jgi:hypothetical protein
LKTRPRCSETVARRKGRVIFSFSLTVDDPIS